VRGNTAADDIIIGKDGIINAKNNQLIIVCGNKEVFRHKLSALNVYDHMSLAGSDIRYADESTGENVIVSVYYDYYR